MMRMVGEIAIAISSSLALSLIVKATVISASALIAAHIARRSRASIRHVLLAAAFTLLLALPLVSVAAPPREVSVSVPQAGSTVRVHPQLVSGLARLMPNVGRLVVDRTGLTGTYDLDLTWTPDQPPSERNAIPMPTAPIDPNGPSLFTALQEQLGLKLESARGPVPVLMIDSVDLPTAD